MEDADDPVVQILQDQPEHGADLTKPLSRDLP
jgi:hypothetical protein